MSKQIRLFVALLWWRSHNVLRANDVTLLLHNLMYFSFKAQIILNYFLSAPYVCVCMLGKRIFNSRLSSVSPLPLVSVVPPFPFVLGPLAGTLRLCQELVQTERIFFLLLKLDRTTPGSVAVCTTEFFIRDKSVEKENQVLSFVCV